MSSSKIFINRNPYFSRCPECKKMGSLHRSRSRNMIEQIIRRITFYKTFRCKECGWRGYRSSVIITKRSFKNIVTYLILILVTAFLARFLLLRFVLTF